MRVLPLLLVCALADTALPSNVASPLSCRLGVLKDLGWEIQQTATAPGLHNTDTCSNDLPPVFTYNQGVEDRMEIQKRSESALRSVTTKCLVSRQYRQSMEASIGKLIDNKLFEFPLKGNDPRDPFIPPAQSWIPAGKRGYDIPRQSISTAVDALYTKPFISECSAAAQIAQLALFKEHYGVFTDAILQPQDIGIGIWPEYIKNPSMTDKSALLINSKKRKKALKELANLGRGAFYGQSGYIKPYRNLDYIDSMDNRGQNFVIVDISPNAVGAIEKRKRPLKELSKLSKSVWKRYKTKLDEGGDKEQLVKQMELEFEALDPFFSEIEIYVHPLSVRTFAFHLARQFKWNPRTPFIFEMYEDFQSGYFHKRYVDYRLRQCEQQSYCRKIDRRTFILTDETGIPNPQVFTSNRHCQAALGK